MTGPSPDAPELFAFEVAAKSRAVVDAHGAAAMRKQIKAWHDSGTAVGMIQQQMLMDQAYAVDLAVKLGRPTAISGAIKVLMETLQGFHLVRDVPAGGTDWDKLAARFAAADGRDVPAE